MHYQLITLEPLCFIQLSYSAFKYSFRELSSDRSECTDFYMSVTCIDFVLRIPTGRDMTRSLICSRANPPKSSSSQEKQYYSSDYLLIQKQETFAVWLAAHRRRQMKENQMKVLQRIWLFECFKEVPKHFFNYSFSILWITCYSY